jgi:acyl-CoA thioesterase II
LTTADATAAPSILDLLDLEYVEENLYRCCTVLEWASRLYGGQVAAQAIYAAGRTVPDGRLPHSLHGYFLRQGSAARPTLFRVERDRDGQAFSARRVVAVQDGEVIFNMATSFAVPRPGADLDAEPCPEMPAPDKLPRWTHPHYPSFEFRPAEDGHRLPSRFWIRCMAELPDDPLLHAAVLTYISDISNGLVTLEGDDMRSGPSLDHAVWFHRPARMDEWTWQDLVPQTAAGGRGLYTGAIFSADRSRVASIAQEALFRKRNGREAR